MVATLKRCLKVRGVTYKDLADLVHLSESSIKRSFASNSLSLQRFEQICEAIGLSIFDIGEMVREENVSEDTHILSKDQEQALAKDVKLLIGFHLILNGWDFELIKNSFIWSETEVIKIFTTLDRLGLITLLPGNKVQTLTAHNIRWRKNGAIRKRHQKTAFAEFLNDRFTEEAHFLDFEVLELSPASTAILMRKMEMLLREVNELAKIDFSLDGGSKQSTGILLAARPWVYSLAVEAMTEEYRQKRGNLDLDSARQILLLASTARYALYYVKRGERGECAR